MDTIDGFTGQVLLPVSALLASIFIGWRADRALVQAETGLTGGAFATWRFLIAWVCPIGVSLILVFGLFPGLLV